MGRKKIPGLRCRNGIWHVEKNLFGKRICQSTGTSNQEEAELILIRIVDEIRQSEYFGIRPQRTFREAATKFLNENLHLRSIETYGFHLKQLDPYIGDLTLDRVHSGTLEKFIVDRRQAGKKTKTINLALGTVRRILNLAARLWRHENGLTWLETPPLIQMLPILDARKPYPLDWDEEDRLFQALPPHLQNMCEFKVNTGTRENEVCSLRWDWEIDVPELDTSVFLIPGEFVKNYSERLVVLNHTAKSVIDRVRSQHDEFVFTYKGHPVTKIKNTAWKNARIKTGLEMVRVHDLKHTFGRRLRAAGVPLETRKVLLGHKNGDITSHYSAPELEELIEAANKVCRGNSGKTPALLMLKQKRQSTRKS